MDLDKFYEQYIVIKKDHIEQESIQSKEKIIASQKIGKITINVPEEER